MRALAEEELVTLHGRRDALLQDLKLLLVPKDPNDEKNVLLEIRGRPATKRRSSRPSCFACTAASPSGRDGGST